MVSNEHKSQFHIHTNTHTYSIHIITHLTSFFPFHLYIYIPISTEVCFQHESSRIGIHAIVELAIVPSSTSYGKKKIESREGKQDRERENEFTVACVKSHHLLILRVSIAILKLLQSLSIQ